MTSERHYRRLFETTHVGILILDCQTRKITEVNPFITRLTGYPPNALIGKKISQIELFKNNEVINEKMFDDLRENSEAEYDNIVLKTFNGEEKIVEILAKIYQDDGKKMMQCTVRDLTEKVRAQRELFETKQRLEALMNSLPVGVTFSLDPKFEKIEVNPYMKKKMEMEEEAHITATRDKTFIVGHKYRHLKDGKELKPSELPMQRAIAEDRLVGPIEGEVELPSGKRWHAEGYAAPVRNHEGKIIGAVAVNIDLTERRKADEAERLTLVVKQEKEKLGFIADAAHELRTPLSIIKGNVDLALKDKLETREALRAVDAEVLHLTNILSDLSLLTTKEGDFKKNTRTQKVEIGKVVKKIAERHRGVASKKDITIDIASLPSMEIFADEYYLERLFTNIISNAISYGRNGGHIWIKGEIREDVARIMVKDDGIGISEKDLPHIFERFYRAEESRSRDFGGSGLGLAIVKWITESLGGNVEADSTFGKGSEFTVSFHLYKKSRPVA